MEAVTSEECPHCGKRAFVVYYVGRTIQIYCDHCGELFRVITVPLD